MIGDWVKVLPISHKVEPHYDRIESIRKEYTGEVYIEGGYHDREHKGVGDWFDWSVGLEYIAPIPFSEEIFEKNRFERKVFNDTIIYSKNSYVDIDWYNVIVEIGKDAEGIQRWDCVCIKIQKAGANLTLHNQSYFHQLQHALRLVGLNEMAVAKFYDEQLQLRMDAYARERKALAEIEKLKEELARCRAANADYLTAKKEAENRAKLLEKEVTDLKVPESRQNRHLRDELHKVRLECQQAWEKANAELKENKKLKECIKRLEAELEEGGFNDERNFI